MPLTFKAASFVHWSIDWYLASGSTLDRLICSVALYVRTRCWGLRTVVSGTKGQWIFINGSKLQSSSQLKK